MRVASLALISVTVVNMSVSDGCKTALQIEIRKLRKKLRQIENLERLDRALIEEEIIKVNVCYFFICCYALFFVFFSFVFQLKTQLIRSCAPLIASM